MTKSIVISERDNIAAIIKDSKVSDFYIHRGDILLGDVYLASVENILPSIDAAFVNVGSDKMGFLHASDVMGKGALQEKLKPKQKILVQVVKEPTGHKGPRVTMALSMPGRFLVLMPDEKGISISRKIASAKERSRLKSVVSLLKPAGVGVIIRTEAEGQSEAEIQEDLELLLEKWNNIVSAADTVEPPSLVSRDQDLLHRVIREACTEDVEEIIVDTSFALHRVNQLLQSWNMNKNVKTSVHKGMDPLLVSKGIDKEIRSALQTKVNLPSGGYLFIQQTEALTVIDVNSGRFTSSATQGETIRKTNLESATEIARQLRLRNIGGMIIVDFIDMDNRVDKLSILEEFELALEPDKSKPQVGQLSDLGLVELTRHRQGQSLSEIFTKKCTVCSGNGVVVDGLNFASSPQESEYKAKSAKIKLPQARQPRRQGNGRPQSQSPKQQEQRHKKPFIKTSPSVVASEKSTVKTDEKQDFELTNDGIKELIDKNGVSQPLSGATRMATMPAKVVKKHMPEEFEKDVFMIMEDIETPEKQIKAPAKKVVKPRIRKTQADSSAKSSTPDVKEETIEPRESAPQKAEELVVEKKPVRRGRKPKAEVEKEVSVEKEAPKPKPRRGRRPKAATEE